MKAIDHTFAEIELPKPSPAGRDLLVKVEAVSVNPVDYKQRKQASSGRVLGWDAAGTVAAVGPETNLFKPGDEVYYAGDVTRPGCNSEFHLVDELHRRAQAEEARLRAGSGDAADLDHRLGSVLRPDEGAAGPIDADHRRRRRRRLHRHPAREKLRLDGDRHRVTPADQRVGARAWAPTMSSTTARTCARSSRRST